MEGASGGATVSLAIGGRCHRPSAADFTSAPSFEALCRINE
jgi:hypothetical protein